MKTLLATLLCFLAHSLAQAQDWPRNVAGKVEFTGLLPWPPTVKTEAQRQALVRRWYMARLTDLTAEEVASEENTAVSTSLATYAGLPLVTSLETGAVGSRHFICFDAHLTAEKSGLRYRLNRMAFYSPTTPADSKDAELEDYLARKEPTPENEKTALAALRKRFAMAVAGWPKK